MLNLSIHLAILQASKTQLVQMEIISFLPVCPHAFLFVLKNGSTIVLIAQTLDLEDVSDSSQSICSFKLSVSSFPSSLFFIFHLDYCRNILTGLLDGTVDALRLIHLNYLRVLFPKCVSDLISLLLNHLG